VESLAERVERIDMDGLLASFGNEHFPLNSNMITKVKELVDLVEIITKLILSEVPLNFSVAIAHVGETSFTHVSIRYDPSSEGDFSTVFKLLQKRISGIGKFPFFNPVGVVAKFAHSGKFAKADVSYRFFGAHLGKGSLLEAEMETPLPVGKGVLGCCALLRGKARQCRLEFR